MQKEDREDLSWARAAATDQLLSDFSDTWLKPHDQWLEPRCKMVGRFESAELKRDALAHEDLQNRQGLLGTFACLLGVAITVMGFVGIASPLVTLDALPLFHMGSPALPGPTGDRDDLADAYDASGSASGLATTRWAASHRGDRDGDVWGWIEAKEPEVSHLHVDFSLIALIITLLSVCVIPPLLKSPSFITAPTGEGMLNRSAEGAQGQQFPLSDLLGGQPGRLIDVKPGEMLSGSQSGGLFGATAGAAWNSPWGSSNLWGTGVAGPTNAMDWTATAPSWQPPMVPNQGWSGPGSGFGQGVGPMPGTGGLYGSWNTAVPSPYSGRGLNAPQSTGLAAASGPPAVNEAEVQETYATFGEQLQQWAPAIAAALDQEVISQVLQQLEQSDQMWHQALGPRGWRLSTELPQTGRTAYGLGGSTQEISVFERNLPKPFCDDPQANQLWQRRQQLEKFLVHPLYGPTVRQYVLERLRDWRQRGILNATRHDTWRPNPNMPTDAHILENLVFQTLNLSMEFCDCFLAAGQAPPRVKHLGQAPSAFLRQTVDQTPTPKPVPHYEVVVLQKVWKLRPGNRNLLEALALLMHALRKNSRSYNSFPQSLRNVMEGSANPWLSSFQNLYNRFF